MLAQTSTIVTIAIPSIGFAAIIGCYVWVSRHMANTKIHPEKKDIVYVNVCEKQHKLDAKLADERHKEVRESLGKIETNIQTLLKK